MTSLKNSGLVLLACLIFSPCVSADALDDAILRRAEKEHTQDLRFGVAGQAKAHLSANGTETTSEKQNKLSAEEKAEAAIEGLAESVAASRLTQHSITHSSSSVAQLPKTH